MNTATTTGQTVHNLYTLVRAHAPQSDIRSERDYLIAQDPVKAFTMGMAYEDNPSEVFDGNLAIKAKHALYALPSEEREQIQANARQTIVDAANTIHNSEKLHKYLDTPVRTLETALYNGINHEKFITRDGPCETCTDLLAIVDSVKVLDALYLNEEKTMDIRWKSLGNILTEFVYK